MSAHGRGEAFIARERRVLDDARLARAMTRLSPAEGVPVSPKEWRARSRLRRARDRQRASSIKDERTRAMTTIPTNTPSTTKGRSRQRQRELPELRDDGRERFCLLRLAREGAPGIRRALRRMVWWQERKSAWRFACGGSKSRRCSTCRRCPPGRSTPRPRGDGLRLLHGLFTDSSRTKRREKNAAVRGGGQVPPIAAGDALRL